MKTKKKLETVFRENVKEEQTGLKGENGGTFTG